MRHFSLARYRPYSYIATTGHISAFASHYKPQTDSNAASCPHLDTNLSTVTTLTIRPASDLPADECGVRWTTRESACCRFHFVTGSAAERGLAQIMPTAADAVSFVEHKFDARLRGKLDVYLIGRMIV